MAEFIRTLATAVGDKSGLLDSGASVRKHMEKFGHNWHKLSADNVLMSHPCNNIHTPVPGGSSPVENRSYSVSTPCDTAANPFSFDG